MVDEKEILEKKEQKSQKEIRRLFEEKAKLSAQLAAERAKTSAHKLRDEFKKSTSTAIIAAFSLLIALVWKDVITGYVDKISAAAPFQGKIISALLVTFICVVGILFVTRLLAVKEEK